jgi:hypothetical protein
VLALLVRFDAKRSLCYAQVALLTYPLTLVPPAQMIEHYIVSSCGAGSPSAAAPLSAGSEKAQYGALDRELDRTAHDTETAAPSSENSPLNGSAATSEKSQYRHHDAEEAATAAPSEAPSHSSQFCRMTTRAAIVLFTTVIATFVPCFGMVCVAPMVQSNVVVT